MCKTYPSLGSPAKWLRIADPVVFVDLNVAATYVCYEIDSAPDKSLGMMALTLLNVMKGRDQSKINFNVKYDEV